MSAKQFYSSSFNIEITARSKTEIAISAIHLEKKYSSLYSNYFQSYGRGTPEYIQKFVQHLINKKYELQRKLISMNQAKETQICLYQEKPQLTQVYIHQNRLNQLLIKEEQLKSSMTHAMNQNLATSANQVYSSSFDIEKDIKSKTDKQQTIIDLKSKACQFDSLYGNDSERQTLKSYSQTASEIIKEIQELQKKVSLIKQAKQAKRLAQEQLASLKSIQSLQKRFDQLRRDEKELRGVIIMLNQTNKHMKGAYEKAYCAIVNQFQEIQSQLRAMKKKKREKYSAQDKK